MTIEVLPQSSVGTLDEAYGRIEQVGEQLDRVRTSIGRVIFGQADVVDETLITLLAGGHLLLVGVPDLAKTLLVKPWEPSSAWITSESNVPPT
jgi:hypothetical protein